MSRPEIADHERPSHTCIDDEAAEMCWDDVVASCDVVTIATFIASLSP